MRKLAPTVMLLLAAFFLLLLASQLDAQTTVVVAGGGATVSTGASSLLTTGSPVDVAASAPPAGAGYSLVTTDPTHSTWQLAASSGGTVMNATVPSFMSVSGGGTATLAFSFGSQSQGLYLGSPCSGAGAPIFRAICSADLPAISESQVTGLVTDLGGKQPTGSYITALTGDVSASGPGSATATLASVVSASTQTKITYDAKGRVTAGAQAACGDLSNFSIMCSSSDAANLTGTLSSARLPNVGTAGTFGDSTHTLTVVTDTQGRLSSVTTNVIAAAGANVNLSNLSSTAINAALATGAGTTLNLTATAPAAASSSQAGAPVNITASPAVDGTSTHPAAAGGNISMTPGAAVNSGTQGKVIVQASTSSGAAAFDVLPGSGSSYTRIFNNGTMEIVGDPSTGSAILTLKTLVGSLTTIFQVNFNSISSLVPHSFGGGTTTIDNNGILTTKAIQVPHLVGNGTNPTIQASGGSCGTSPSVGGKDLSFHITVGTGVPTACTVTFGLAYGSAPDCQVTLSPAGSASPPTVSSTTTTVTVSTAAGTLVASEVLHVHCF